MTTTMTLRPYQEEALDRVDAAVERGVRSLLGVAATGLGKTIMFVELARRRGGRTLILAHRDELISQAVAKVAEAERTRPLTAAAEQALRDIGREDLLDGRDLDFGGDGIGIVRAKANDVASTIVVASIQTLSRQARLDQLADYGPADTVIVDEAHHALADSYRFTLTVLLAGHPDGPLLFGVTATPERGDGKGLGSMFDEIAFNYDILWGIRSGYLSDLRARRIVLTGFDETKLKVSRGDFTEGSSGAALTDAGAPRHIVAGWMHEAMGRKTLVFTPTVQLAKDVAEAFNAAGISAGWVSGETPRDERIHLLEQFRLGHLTVMVNCAVLTEGYDEPTIQCVVIARPTKNRGLYIQMVGRGTRRHPDKDDCLVLDVVGATEQHTLITIPTLFGLDADAAVRQGTKSISQGVIDHEAQLVAAGRLAARDADLFRRLDASEIAWVSTTDVRSGNPSYVRQLGKEAPRVVLIQRERGIDRWVAGLVHPDGRKQVLVDNAPLESAQAQGEDYVRRSGKAHLTMRDAPWRAGPPSPRQLQAAARWRITPPEGITAGELSEMIDAKAARAEQMKAERERAKRRVG